MGTTIGLLHPGDMGSGIGAVLHDAGHEVLFCSTGRSEETLRRANAAGLVDAGTLVELVRRAEVIASVCPPHAAIEVAEACAGFTGLYLDANAISPGTAERVRETVESFGARYCDGGIIGGPPTGRGRTALYLSGPYAQEAAGLFSGDKLTVTALDGGDFSASGLKMVYGSVTKGDFALVIAAQALARRLGVEDALVAEWGTSSERGTRSLSAGLQAATKGWRWVGEMEEIAKTYRSVDLPGGFHDAAAEIYRRSPYDPSATADAENLDRVLNAVAEPPRD